MDVGVAKKSYCVVVKKDGKFYAGYCLEFLQARGQGDTRAEAIEDAKKAIKLWITYLSDKKKKEASRLVTVSI